MPQLAPKAHRQPLNVTYEMTSSHLFDMPDLALWMQLNSISAPELMDNRLIFWATPKVPNAPRSQLSVDLCVETRDAFPHGVLPSVPFYFWSSLQHIYTQ